MTRTLRPFREGALRPLDDFYKEMDSLVNSFLYSNGEGGGTGFQPSANLAETETGYELSLDLPGIAPQDVHVEMHDGKLFVSGERKAEKEEKGKTFHRIERSYGSFRRMVSVPTPVDEEHITADYVDGVLTVKLPKSNKAKPRRIPVQKPE